MCPFRYTRRFLARNFRRLAPLSLVVVGACSTQDVEIDTPTGRFSSYPTALMGAAKLACDGPAESFVRVNSRVSECRMYLPPLETAELILQHDGTPEKLPQMVVRFETRREGADFFVDTYAYAEVPQKSGKVIRINQMTSRAKRQLEQIYVAAGATQAE